jgi:hypothetical protein
MNEWETGNAIAAVQMELQVHRQALVGIADELRKLRTGGGYPNRLSAQQYWEHKLKDARYSDPLRLLKFGWKAYSQSEEDGIIHEIFHRIGEGTRTFVEVGTEGGNETNTVALLMSGWQGAWIEADLPEIEIVRTKLRPYCESGALRAVDSFVTRENVEQLMKEYGPAAELSLLSIDVDGNDYWIWEAIESVRPRVVVIEYNATWHPPLPFVVPYDPAFHWDGSNYFGASLSAFQRLGERKGYKLVGCCFSGVNAFFVREDLVRNRFASPFTAENHFEPPRYWMLRPSGHPPAVGPVEIR